MSFPNSSDYAYPAHDEEARYSEGSVLRKPETRPTTKETEDTKKSAQDELTKTASEIWTEAGLSDEDRIEAAKIGF